MPRSFPSLCRRARTRRSKAKDGSPRPLQLGGKAAAAEELSPEMMKKQLTPQQWDRIYSMSQDKNLYQNLISSLFPTIHGGALCTATQVASMSETSHSEPSAARSKRARPPVVCICIVLLSCEGHGNAARFKPIAWD